MFDELLQAARSGRSGALVLLGEPGVGKTALLQYAIDSAADMRVVRAMGTESEMELAFAALHQLCAPVLGSLERLPGPQRDALTTTFGLTAGSVPDRFLLGLAVLSLFSEAAEERPLLCLVDDSQWLDRASAQVLGFVARRLLAESVVIVFATREPGEEFRGLPELEVQGLAAGEARDLLASVVRWPLDERVRDQIVAETRGNPLALLELPRGLTPAELAGGFGLPSVLSLPGRIEDTFARRIVALPEETRQLLLVAAAEPVGDPALIRRAADRIGLRPESRRAAEAAGLLEFGARVRFRHPLVRSAAYRAAPPGERRTVHRALAEATDPNLDPDRRAWHRAQAAPGPDEDIAAELERSAARAQGRGGLAAAAAFLERSVGLTPDPARRARRALAAARAKYLCGAPGVALQLLVTAEAGPLDELGYARVDLLRAQSTFASRRGSDAPALLLHAARGLEPLDLGLARDTYLDALRAAIFLGAGGDSLRAREVAEAASAARRPHPPRASDLLLDGLAMRFTRGYSAGAPMLKRALTAYHDANISGEEALRWMAAIDLWDDQMWEALATAHLQLARATGALTELPFALNARSAAHTFGGEPAAAASLIEEARAVNEAIGSHFPPYGGLLLAAWRGREAEATKLIEETTGEVLLRGETYGLSVPAWAHALLYNGLGRFDEALAASERASQHHEHLGICNWGLVELIVAASRVGNLERAAGALERLSDLTRASGSEWALGIEARSRALLSDGEAADRLYLEGIEHLGRTRIRVELARAHLLYGEWLRRERRRLEARAQLRIAHEMFATMGVEAFAGRAERELLATGERARKRGVETREQLTPQELQIARLARDGHSNAEIGGRLFISPRTVEYHLHKVFGKLNVSSRNQLDHALGEGSTAGLSV